MTNKETMGVVFDNKRPLADQLEEVTMGQTFTIPRTDLLKENDPVLDSQMGHYIHFLRYLIVHPNIEGVALSEIKSGGVMADFFVRNTGDEIIPTGVGEITRGLMLLLGIATGSGIRSIRSGEIRLGDATFEQKEQEFRDYYDQTYDYDYNSASAPFDFMTHRNGEMELATIVRFI